MRIYPRILELMHNYCMKSNINGFSMLDKIDISIGDRRLSCAFDPNDLLFAFMCNVYYLTSLSFNLYYIINI